MTKTEIVCV